MFGLCDGGAPGFDGKEATDNADIGEAIHDEAEADGGGFGASCAEALDELCGDEGADNACTIEHRAIEPDGIWEVFFADKLDEKCLARGHVKDLCNAEEAGEDGDVPELDVACDDEESHGQGEDALDYLHRENEVTLRHPVRECTADEGPEEHRECAKDGDDSQPLGCVFFRIREQGDEPVLACRLDPSPDE